MRKYKVRIKQTKQYLKKRRKIYIYIYKKENNEYLKNNSIYKKKMENA